MPIMRISAMLSCVFLSGLACAQGVGVFEDHQDVGVNPRSGASAFDPAAGSYRITGGGANVWGTADAFQFVWKRVTGDLTLTADVHFEGAGVNAHRKAMLMVRQSLTSDSPYADVALHGDGLVSLQFRPEAGAETQELRSPVNGPSRIRLERRGNEFRIWVGKPGEELAPTGPQTVQLPNSIYVGLAVCSHEADGLETAVFENVRLEQPQPAGEARYRSKIMIWNLASRSARLLYQADELIEAPNWSRDGRFLLVNTGGGLYRLPVSGGKPEKIDLGPGNYDCNNDHDLSRDGQWLAFSASSPTSPDSQVYVARADGTQARLLTETAPSYFHGWSPDGHWLAFVGRRNGKYELYRIPRAGGPEERLTSRGAYDDGPEYSPDGKWIYFNSNRSGGWDIWRMPAGGAGTDDAKAERITSDSYEDWFPHFSPNGKWMAMLSFPAGTEGHDERREGVALRLMTVPGKKWAAGPIQVLTTFFGGQGSFNVNSWSPDSRSFAYVVYEPLGR